MWLNREAFQALTESATRGRVQGELIAELRGQITELKDSLRLALDRADREQQRADTALDTVAGVRAGIQPVSPPPARSTNEPDPHEEDAAEVERIRQDIIDRGPVDVLASMSS